MILTGGLATTGFIGGCSSDVSAPKDGGSAGSKAGSDGGTAGSGGSTAGSDGGAAGSDGGAAGSDGAAGTLGDASLDVGTDVSLDVAIGN